MIKLYLVSPGKIGNIVISKYPTVGALCSFIDRKEFDRCVNVGFKSIMLDSGAFSVYRSGKLIDIDKYIFFIKEKQSLGIDFIPVNLDVIGDESGYESIKNWEYMKDKGVTSLPVYHTKEPLDVLDYYVKNCDYVGIGGVAGKIVHAKWLVSSFTRIFNRHEHKYHIFGVNDIRVISMFPFYSCDSLTWKSGSRYGRIMIPQKGEIRISGRATDSISETDASTLNLKVWLNKKGIPFPLPENYNFELLDLFNIEVIYEELSLKNRYYTSYNMDLF